MTAEIPDGLPQLQDFLLTEFRDIVPPAASGATAEERERNFLSRALAAYAVQKLAGCSKEDAASSVVDGGGDGGIDAIYYARQTTDTIWIIQSKFVASGTGEPDGLEKFRNGVEAVLSANLGYFSENAAWQKRIPEIAALLNNSDPLQVHAVFVYSSIHAINSKKSEPFDKLVEQYGHGYFAHSSYNLSSLMDWLTGADKPIGVPKVDITFYEPGHLDSPYETIYGLIKLTDIAEKYAQYGKQLVAANIRGYKGDTQVNDGILATLTQKPHLFIYYNNGLTAYCKRLSVTNADRGRSEYKRVTAYDFSVVNGAQTLGTINSRFTGADGAPPPDGYVFIKLISLEHCENDDEFAQEITRTANYQNRIDSQNFIAQQPYQQEIARTLLLSDIHYHFRDDADVPTSDEYNFNLKDATTALACLEQMNDCDFVVRVLSNRASLWSSDEDYPDEPLNKTRYSKVFNASRSARAVWRAVQTQNIVIDRMKENTRVADGVRKAFFENARWLLLNIIFLRLRPEQGNEMTVPPGEVERISAFTVEYAELLWSVCETLGYVSRKAEGGGYDSPRHFRSVFSDPADCARLRSKILEQLNQRPPSNNGSEG